MLQRATIKFLRDLRKNNNKVWFDKNRASYENAKSDFATLVDQVILLHSKKDPGIKSLTAKDCMFRINRDVRFSKDKSPYKINFGASINKAGKKAWNTAGYYFHLEPGKSFAGGGLYMPEPEILKKVRQEIDYDLPGINKILRSGKFKTVYGDLDRTPELMLSRVPKGYEPGNPAADLLRFKSYIAMVNIPDEILLSKDAAKKIAAAFDALQPLVGFLNKATSS